MSFNKLTNFVIAALVVLAIFLTGRLWLDDFSSRGLFYSPLKDMVKTKSQPYEDLEIIEPKRVILGYGNKKFSVLYSETSEKDIKPLFLDSLKEVFAQGSFLGTEALDFSSLLNSGAVIFEYPFNVSISEYIGAFKDVSADIAKKFSTFDYVALIPSGLKNSKLEAVFVNMSSEEAFRFSVDKSRTTDKLYSAIEDAQVKNSGLLSYISTAQNNFSMFASDIFVPQWKSGEYSAMGLIKVNPYSLGGDIDKESLLADISEFFGGSLNIYDSSENDSSEDVFISSDDTRVIKYYSTGILEYYNYDSVSGRKDQTLSEAYTVCKMFMDLDNTLSSEVYLSSAEFSSDGLVFYFDYVIDNIPVAFSSSFKDEAGISHAAEVIVKNGVVKNYRRYLPYYAYSGSSVEIGVDFIGVIDSVMSSSSDIYQGGFINEIEFSYLDTGEKDTSPGWIVLIDKKAYEVGACR